MSKSNLRSWKETTRFQEDQLVHHLWENAGELGRGKNFMKSVLDKKSTYIGPKCICLMFPPSLRIITHPAQKTVWLGELHQKGFLYSPFLQLSHLCEREGHLVYTQETQCRGIIIPSPEWELLGWPISPGQPSSTRKQTSQSKVWVLTTRTANLSTEGDRGKSPVVPSGGCCQCGSPLQTPHPVSLSKDHEPTGPC